jgi:benzoyl-CoA 2,3-dioxygenase component B
MSGSHLRMMGHLLPLLCMRKSDQGYYAGWIAPPKMGIDNKSGDFEFVQIQ